VNQSGLEATLLVGATNDIAIGVPSVRLSCCKPELRANATDLERRGGKFKFSTCEKRIGAQIDSKASGVVYGENGEKWMILGGY
jgi:hypothetical protein